jgi:acyl carrier protein phosphodiesterase
VKKGIVIALSVAVITALLLVAGTIWPVPSAVYFAGGAATLQSPSTPEMAVDNLGTRIRQQDWNDAYNSLSNLRNALEFRGTTPSRLCQRRRDEDEAALVYRCGPL